MTRSSRPDVRNPLLALPSVQGMATLDRAALVAFVGVLKEIERDCREKADKCWRTHKAPMAAYWKANAVYARHLRVALNSIIKAKGQTA